MKKFMILLMIIILCITPNITLIRAQAASKIILSYNGKPMNYSGKKLKASYNGMDLDLSDAPGILLDNTALFSYEDVYVNSNIHAKASFNKSTKIISIQLNDKKIVMKLGSKIAKVNNVKKQMTVAPIKATYEKNNETKILVPTRFVSENLGLNYAWYSAKGLIAIEKKGLSLYYDGSNHNYLGANINFKIDNQSISTKMSGLLIDGYVLAPVNYIVGTNGLDLEYSFSSSDNTLTINKEGTSLKITMDSQQAMINDKAYKMPTKARIVRNNDNNHTYLMVPLEFIIKRLGFQYSYDSAVNTAYISTHTEVNVEDKVNTITIQKQISGIKIKETKDDYWNKEFVITLNGNYSGYYGSSINSNAIKIEDSTRASVLLGLDEAMNSKITIKTNIIRGFIVTENDNVISITIKPPKDIYKKIVVIDAGHGGSQVGANGANYGNELIEKTLNLDFLLRAKYYFDQNAAIRVYYTRIDDSNPSLAKRAKMANEVDADLFISIHNDAYPDNVQIRGTKVFYSSSKNQEADSGLSSSRLARVILQHVYSAVGSVNRGVDRKSLQVLNQSNVPAVLLEVAFLSNDEDANILRSEIKREEISKSLYDAVVETLSSY